jgi:hypothetical protein
LNINNPVFQTVEDGLELPATADTMPEEAQETTRRHEDYKGDSDIRVCCSLCGWNDGEGGRC